MYVVIDKKTKRITQINHAPFKQELTDERQYYRFDPKTMDMGHADGDPGCEPTAADSADNIVDRAELQDEKQACIDNFSRMALTERQRILPDYKLQNASLGLYDEDRIAAYRATVQAFRDEFHRLEGLIERVQSIGELQAIRASFPTEIAG